MQFLVYFFKILSSENELENYNHIFRMQYLYDTIVVYPPMIITDSVLVMYPSNEGNDKRMKKKNSSVPSLRELILIYSYHF